MQLLLLAKEETVLQGVIGRLIEVGRRCGMGMNEDLKATIPGTAHDRSKTPAEFGTFQLYW
jgi:hypothetical protein